MNAKCVAKQQVGLFVDWESDDLVPSPSRVSLIAGLEYEMERWNGKWNGKWNGMVSVHNYG